MVHDVLADEASDYVRRHDIVTGGADLAHDLDLWLTFDASVVTVERLPGRAAFPRPGAVTRLFALGPGQVGRYRANFRFRHTNCACDPSWYYEDWLVHVANGAVAPDRFLRGEPDRDVHHRVHLYGGPARRGNRHRC